MTDTIDVAAVTAAVTAARDSCEEALALLSGGSIVPPDPGPPTRDLLSLVGACPNTNGVPADVPKKWGTPVALRSFSSGGFSAASRPDGVDCWHHSWKPTLGQPISKSQIATGLTNAVEGDLFTVWHESDVKFRNGSFTRAQADQAIALSIQFHDLVHEMIDAGDLPPVETVDVYAAWMFLPKSGLFPGTPTDARTAAFWLTQHCSDLIGIDCDAMENKSAYPDFTDAVRNTIASVGQYGRVGWTVPEWMHYRIDGDSSGTKRAQWFTSQGQMFLDSVPRPRAVQVFDTNYAGRVQVIEKGTPEFAAIQQLMVDGRVPQAA